MDKQWIPLALLALAMSGAYGQAASQPQMAMDPASAQLDQAMKAGMDSMARMKMSGDLDKDFASMMRLHHQQAVDMARVEAEHGKSPEIKAMARKMMRDQQKEIAQMDAWLKKHP